MDSERTHTARLLVTLQEVQPDSEVTKLVSKYLEELETRDAAECDECGASLDSAEPESKTCSACRSYSNHIDRLIDEAKERDNER